MKLPVKVKNLVPVNSKFGAEFENVKFAEKSAHAQLSTYRKVISARDIVKAAARNLSAARLRLGYVPCSCQ